MTPEQDSDETSEPHDSFGDPAAGRPAPSGDAPAPSQAWQAPPPAEPASTPWTPPSQSWGAPPQTEYGGRAWSPPRPSPGSPPETAWSPVQHANMAPAWRSVHGLGVALQVLLWISLAASLLMMGALANERAKADDVIGGNVFALEDLNDAIDAADAVNALGGMLAIAVFVLLIIYCWRGAKNIETLGRTNPTLGSGWAIGAWFIPLASAILVPLVFAGVWKGSDPTVPPGVRDWKRAPLSALLPLWWVAWILGSSLLGLGEALYTNEAGEYETIADLRSANTLSMIGTVVIAGAVVFSVLFVSKLTQRLDIWGEHLGYESRSGGPTGP